MSEQFHKTIKTTVEGISGLPTLPTVIDRLTRLLSNPQTSADEVGRAITVDQSLASKVLKLVNSAFYGFPGKISTITHAVVILGFATIKNIVLTASILDAFKKQGSEVAGFDMNKFWEHSIACGAASQSIAKRIGFEEKESCFIAGLIHDIGKIILCQYMPREFAQIVTAAATRDVLFYEAEKDLFDITHQEVGGMLAQRWNLPQNLQYTVQYHHAPLPTRNHYTITAVVHAADIIVRAMDFGNGGDVKIPLMSDTVWKTLGLDNTSLGQLLESVDEDVRKAAIFTQII